MTNDPASPEAEALRELHRIVHLVNSEKDLADVLQAAAQGVVDVLGFSAVAVNLLTQRGDFEAVTVVGPATELLTGSRNDRDDFLAELAAADEWGRLRFVPAGRYRYDDSVVVWRSSEPPRDVPDAWHPEDALYAPLHATDGDLVGILSVDLPNDGRRPGPLRRQILEMYAVQIGLAISHARERERLLERVRLAAATHAIVQTAAERSDLPQILAASVEPLMEGFRTDRAWIRLFADEGGGWEALNFPVELPTNLHASTAEEGSYPPLDTDRVLATASRLARACWKGQRTLTVSAVAGDSSDGLLSTLSRLRVLDWVHAFHRSQFVMLPLGAGDACLGYVVLLREESVGDWTGSENDAALVMGRELGRIIETARMRQRERQLVRELEDLDTYKSEMITTVVHELKTPLTSIQGNLELAADDPSSTERAHAAIASGAARMARLVHDMLTLVRLRDPHVVLPHTDVDLSAVVDDVRTTLAVHARRAEVEVDLSAVETGVTVRADPTEIERMLVNLVSNAIKFSTAGGSVRLGLRRSRTGIEFSCTDTGLGIATKDRASLFDEFDRSSNAHARTRPGSGLGLAIAQRVAQRHGGAITVDSELGRGSTFLVRLPAHRPEDRTSG